MKESGDNRIREKSWRRRLTAAEEAELKAWLAAHPGSEADWEAEKRLTEVLNRLPEAPVSSNFTARVLQAVDREAAATNRAPARTNWFFRLLLPRVAMAAVVLVVGVLTYQRHENAITQRAEVVQGVKTIASVPTLPSPEVLQDFETIRQMSATAGPDPEIIALMK